MRLSSLSGTNLSTICLLQSAVFLLGLEDTQSATNPELSETYSILEGQQYTQLDRGHSNREYFKPIGGKILRRHPKEG